MHIRSGFRPARGRLTRLDADTEQSLPIFTAQHAGDTAPARNGNAVQDAPIRRNANEGIFVEKAHPHGLIAVDTNSVGRAELAEAPVEFERTVGADVEACQAVAIGFRNHHPPTVAWYRAALGKDEAVRHHT